MVRLRRQQVVKKMNDEVFAYTSSKAQLLAKTNPCLATDYVIRALGVKPKDPDTLALGAILGKAVGQAELASKCLASAGRSSLIDENSLQAVTEVPMETLTVMPNLRQLPSDLGEQGEDELSSNSRSQRQDGSGISTAPIASTTPTLSSSLFEELVHEIRVNSGHKVELRDNNNNYNNNGSGGTAGSSGTSSSSVFGRGLYAAERVPGQKETLLQERAIFVNPTRSDTSCANCLKSLAPVEGSGNVKCDNPTCSERYCSATCRDDAIQSYHAPLCQNEEFAAWKAQVKATMQDFDASSGGSSSSNSSSDSKAALMLLMIGRICAVATMAQTHPLSVPPLNAMSGMMVYQPRSTFLNMGGISMGLGSAMRQPQFFLEDLLSMMALLRNNEWRTQRGFLLFRWLCFINHSCVPNAELQEVGAGDQPAEWKLVAVKPMRAGEQIFIDYSTVLGARLPRTQRREYLQSRGVDCHCSLCARGQ